MHGLFPRKETDMNELYDNIKLLIENKKIGELHRMFHDMPAADIAELLTEFEDDKLLLLFRILPKEAAADVFVLMDTDEMAELI